MSLVDGQPRKKKAKQNKKTRNEKKQAHKSQLKSNEAHGTHFS